MVTYSVNMEHMKNTIDSISIQKQFFDKPFYLLQMSLFQIFQNLEPSILICIRFFTAACKNIGNDFLESSQIFFPFKHFHLDAIPVGQSRGCE